MTATSLSNTHALVLFLCAPYFSSSELRTLVLASRDVAAVMVRELFSTLHTIKISQAGNCDLLHAVLGSAAWRHAHLVRRLTINIDCKSVQAVSNQTGASSSEALAAKIISAFPNLQHVHLASTLPIPSYFSPYGLYPSYNFAPIAHALAKAGRLSSVQVSGPFLGGFTCPVDLLEDAGRHVRTLRVSMSSHRDGGFWARFCAGATGLRVLDVRSGTGDNTNTDADAVTVSLPVDCAQVRRIVEAIPRKESLAVLEVHGRSCSCAYHADSAEEEAKRKRLVMMSSRDKSQPGVTSPKCWMEDRALMERLAPDLDRQHVTIVDAQAKPKEIEDEEVEWSA
ncbi:hypothetical protein DL93DRAFT_1636859 [Clavulina sp. PMI_390]|nr:hypothetical protein DL93DRAFT_1636859 [Clavulina sp. PMI_390]